LLRANDSELLELLGLIVRRAGLSPHFATRPLVPLDGQRPTAAIVDVRNGEDVQVLRTLWKLNVPALALVLDLAELPLDACDLARLEYVCKPFVPSELIAWLSSRLGGDDALG
jgi:DNA-binding response OmpR family regulator